MGKIIVSLVVIALFFSCSEKQVKSPIDGAWKLVYSEWPIMKGNFPADIQGSNIKMWSDGHFTFVGQFKLDSGLLDSYGGGTFKLNGNKYEENIIYHTNRPWVGTKAKMLLEIRKDSLIQKYPTNENWELPDEYNTEIYVRLRDR
jgi:hypothetical protein